MIHFLVANDFAIVRVLVAEQVILSIDSWLLEINSQLPRNLLTASSTTWLSASFTLSFLCDSLSKCLSASQGVFCFYFDTSYEF